MRRILFSKRCADKGKVSQFYYLQFKVLNSTFIRLFAGSLSGLFWLHIISTEAVKDRNTLLIKCMVSLSQCCYFMTKSKIFLQRGNENFCYEYLYFKLFLVLE